MPELAEVEYFRKKWDPGLRRKIEKVELHARKRIFRGADTAQLKKTVTGSRLEHSEARGKQLLFHFSGGSWLGLHMGMTGSLRCEKPAYRVAKHDHLVLRQAAQTLVFRDARLFGRVRFHHGADEPEWWRKMPPALNSPAFTLKFLRELLVRRKRAPLKAVLLNQALFPGVGNWMADEILWQGRVDPRTLAGELTAAESKRLHAKTQSVCRIALETIGAKWGDPPKTWLIHVRWKKGGLCPKHRVQLQRATVAGRTTAWCARCQPSKGGQKRG